MALMTIGEFAERARLSAKALRIYDELGLVVPAEVDPATGYRFYDESQLGRARLVAMLRRLDMPLARIGEFVDLDGPRAAGALAAWWDGVEAGTDQRRALVAYLRSRFEGEESPMPDIQLRSIPERKVLSISRHVTLSDIDAFFGYSFGRLRAAGRGMEGIAGVPFLVFYGEVSDDGDGPVELSRPVAIDTPDDVTGPDSEVQMRVEPAHDEAYIRLSLSEMGWPAMIPYCDALERWTRDHDRQPAAPLRQVLIADQRTAGPDTPVCDLSVALR